MEYLKIFGIVMISNLIMLPIEYYAAKYGNRKLFK